MAQSALPYEFCKTSGLSKARESTQVNLRMSKFNELDLNVDKILFEGYMLANLHIIQLLDEDMEIPPLNQKFFQNVLAQVSVMLYQKEKQYKDKELVTTFEEH